MFRRRDVLKGIGATSIAAATGIGTVAGGGVQNTAKVRVGHFSPDAPAVDVYLDGDRVLSGLEFRSASDYLKVAPGTYEVKITAAGDPSTVAFEDDVGIPEGVFTIAAIGELSEGTFRPKIVDNHALTPLDNFATVQVVHASPDAPAVDVTLSSGRPLFRRAEFGDATFPRLVRAGDYTLQIRASEPGGSGDVVAEASLTLQEGTGYTVYAGGYLTPDDEPADEPFGLVPTSNPPGRVGDGPIGGGDDDTPRLRVAHLSPDAPAVDVLLDGDRAVADLSFRSVTDYLEVPPGTYTAQITPAGDPDTVVFEGDVPVEAGTAYTVAATGELSAETFEPLVFVDDRRIQRGSSRVRVVHAAPDAPAVDVTVNDAAVTLVDGLAFQEESDYLTVDPGNYELEVRPDSASNDNPFDAEFDAPLQPNRTYTAFATGYFTADDEPADEPFGLVLAEDASL